MINKQINMAVLCEKTFKVTLTDATYFTRIKFLKSLVQKKHFGLIWQVVFKLEYLYCQERLDNYFEFEGTWQEVAIQNYSW